LEPSTQMMAGCQRMGRQRRADAQFPDLAPLFSP
jgi:hypothetical protein